MIKYNIAYKNYIYILIPKLGFYRDISYINNIEIEYTKYYLCKFVFPNDSNVFNITIYNQNIFVFKTEYIDDFVFYNEDDGKNYICGNTVEETTKAATNNRFVNLVKSNDITSSATNCLNNNIDVYDLNGNRINENTYDTLYIRNDTYEICADIIKQREKLYVSALNNKIEVTYKIILIDCTKLDTEIYDMPPDYYYKFTDPYNINCDIPILYEIKNDILTCKPINNDDKIDIYKANINGVMRVGTETEIPYDYYKWIQNIDGVEYKNTVFTATASKENVNLNIILNLNKNISSITINYYIKGYDETLQKFQVSSIDNTYTILPDGRSSMISLIYDDIEIDLPYANNTDIFNTYIGGDYMTLIIQIDINFKLDGDFKFTKTNKIPIHDGTFKFKYFEEHNKYIGGGLVTCLNYSLLRDQVHCNVVNPDNFQPSDMGSNIYLMLGDIIIYEFICNMEYTNWTGDDPSDTYAKYMHFILRYMPYFGAYNRISYVDTFKDPLFTGHYYLFKPNDNINFYVHNETDLLKNRGPTQLKYVDKYGYWSYKQDTHLAYRRDTVDDLTRFTGHTILTDLNLIEYK